MKRLSSLLPTSCLECSGFSPRVGQGPPHTDPGCRGSTINPPGKLSGLRCSQGPGPGGHGPGVGEGAGCLQPGHGESGCCLPGAVRCSPPPPRSIRGPHSPYSPTPGPAAPPKTTPKTLPLPVCAASHACMAPITPCRWAPSLGSAARSPQLSVGLPPSFPLAGREA